ncbi:MULTISPECIES: hypothetical protein [unclassified Corallococcus]|uniref:hypothetical protein n=1 Tax=unclassified Corallococcus TaxID=2685029 RepID=UPI001A9037CC|nr:MULTISPECIES: hypothetical protein [unclassified Corallococcus]MBN9687490.1 hypothetical protein [Corallococcus sp. NCSPR001]WAS88687.1 hypothetical protein O0N60_17265 [Corallococcus sp. NCRR]
MRTVPSRPEGDERQAALWACIAVLHLAAVGSFLWTDLAHAKSEAAFDRGVRTYQSLSGVISDYRFFAPSVASDTRTGFFVALPGGRTLFEPLASESLEVGLRYQCIVASGLRANRKTQDVLAQSWAAVMLGVHPEASRVTVVTQSYVLPSLEDWAAGKRPDWTLHYTGTFDRREGPGAEASP